MNVFIIEDKALEYALENKGGFVVDTISASGGCCSMDVREICVRFVEDFPKKYRGYQLRTYKGVDVLIENGLEVEEDVMIYKKIQLPLIGVVFSVKGISVKYL